jgi:hypothetical protein
LLQHVGSFPGLYQAPVRVVQRGGNRPELAGDGFVALVVVSVTYGFGGIRQVPRC